MAKLNTKKASSTKRVIVYGASFSGKTLLVGELAKEFNLIWIDCEAGHGVLFQLPESYQERIEIVALPDTSAFPIAIETILKMTKGAVDICEIHGKVKCMLCTKAKAEFVHVDLKAVGKDTIVVYDTLTQITSSCMSQITKNEDDYYKPTFNDYAKLGGLMDIFLSDVQQAQYSIVCISHENEVTTEGKKSTLSPTGGTRNYSRNITKFFTDVVYLERKNKKHTCISSTTANNTVVAGSQTGISLEWLEKPSLLPLFMPDKYPMPDAPAKGKIPGKPVVKPAAATGAKAASSVLTKLAAMKNRQK